MLVPTEVFLGEDAIRSYNVGIGDDLVIPGLFTARYGRERNVPILRSGTLASVADESLVDDATGLPYRAYLAEMHSMGGLSGSPVYVDLHPDRRFAAQEQGLLPESTRR
jgi:hypothetical protein